MRKIETVELLPAYRWCCPECGTENFEVAYIKEMSDEEVQQLREEYGMDDSQRPALVQRADEVKCKECERWFSTTAFGIESDGAGSDYGDFIDEEDWD